MKVERDEFLEEKMRSYIEGTEQPNVDLSAAEQALMEVRRRRSAKRRARIALASACASFLLIAAVVMGFLFIGGGDMNTGEAPNFDPDYDQSGGSASDPDPEKPPSSAGDLPSGAPSQGIEGDVKPISFALETAEHRAAGASELAKEYGSKLKKLTDLGFSSNYAAEFTLYYAEGEVALLGTELLYTQDGSRVSATVYTDLSGGKYRAAELEKYDSLSQKTSTYTYERTFLNGEYVCLGAFSYLGQSYCATVQSSNADAFSLLMHYLLGK